VYVYMVISRHECAQFPEGKQSKRAVLCVFHIVHLVNFTFTYETTNAHSSVCPLLSTPTCFGGRS
jgi:hypothetical protein